MHRFFKTNSGEEHAEQSGFSEKPKSTDYGSPGVEIHLNKHADATQQTQLKGPELGPFKSGTTCPK